MRFDTHKKPHLNWWGWSVFHIAGILLFRLWTWTSIPFQFCCLESEGLHQQARHLLNGSDTTSCLWFNAWPFHEVWFASVRLKTNRGDHVMFFQWHWARSWHLFFRNIPVWIFDLTLHLPLLAYVSSLPNFKWSCEVLLLVLFIETPFSISCLICFMGWPGLQKGFSKI